MELEAAGSSLFEEILAAAAGVVVAAAAFVETAEKMSMKPG